MRAGTMATGVVAMVGSESMIFGVLVLAIAEAGVFVIVLLRCFGLGKMEAETQNSIDCKAHDHADSDLYANNACHYVPINLFGDEQR